MNAVGHALFDVTLGHLNYVEYVREVTHTYDELVNSTINSTTVQKLYYLCIKVNYYTLCRSPPSKRGQIQSHGLGFGSRHRPSRSLLR